MARDEQPADRLDGATPGGEAARRLIKVERRLLDRALRKVERRGAGASATHALRIATRRAGAVFAVIGSVLEPDALERVHAALKRVRKAAGAGREQDVLLELIEERRDKARRAKNPEHGAWDDLRERARRAGKQADAGLERSAGKLRRVVSRALKHLEVREEALREEAWRAGAAGALAPAAGGEIANLRGLVGRALPRLVGEVRTAARHDLRDLNAVHDLRVKIKALRYGLEVFGHAGEASAAERSAATLASVQRTLGAVQDARMLVDALRERGRSLGKKHVARAAALARLVVREERGLKALLARGVRAWREAVEAGVLRLADDAAHAQRVPAPEPRPPAEIPRSPRALRLAGLAVPLPTGDLTRLAAIDVGSNSIRLIVAEAQTDGSYRVLDDEREMARLAQGLEATGRLDEGAMQRAARAIAHMHQIARGLGASRIRAVATAAVREAKNGPAFVKMVREQAGLDLEVIGAEQEAVLAYRSIAAAFDLSLLTVAVVDIGGGSTQVVLAAGGVIEQVYTVPMGAVRLTEKFGGGEPASGGRYRDLRRFVRALMERELGALPLTPQLVIATGGTATTLGAVALQHGHGPDDLAPGAAVQGLEIKRSTLGRIVRQLRGLSLDGRTRVPGLAAERADIIVPGASILRAVMKQTGAKRVRIHTGGIRDGLLLAMVAEMYPGAEHSGAGATGARDPMRGVYRLARACRFDQRHSEHVARLSLRLHEQLAAIEARDGRAPAWADDDARLVLHAAALVLDVGYLINYAQHHQHSYNLIRHSDLPGLTARQVEMIAAVARYHRGSDPKPKHEALKRLDERDRAVVGVLAGIVRVAVGLDRGHRQVVRDVRVSPAPGGVRISVDAEQDPSVDVWAAQRKSGLLATVLEREVTIEAGSGRVSPGQRDERALAGDTMRSVDGPGGGVLHTLAPARGQARAGSSTG